MKVFQRTSLNGAHLLKLSWQLHLQCLFKLFFLSVPPGIFWEVCSGISAPSWHLDPPFEHCSKALLFALSANARVFLYLWEHAEIKWPQFNVVNHTRGNKSPEVHSEHTVCQDEEARWSLSDSSLEDAFLPLILPIPQTDRTDMGGNRLLWFILSIQEVFEYEIGLECKALNYLTGTLWKPDEVPWE